MRAIHIFPKFENVRSIQDVRERFDPLADKIPPHITLVHPFSDDVSNSTLVEHVAACLSAVEPFTIRLQNITGAPTGYLFLNVKEGNDQLIALRDRLYSGILSPYYYRKVTYVPHITVGQGLNTQEWEAALETLATFDEVFATTVDRVVVEEIGTDDSSYILYEHQFYVEGVDTNANT